SRAWTTSRSSPTAAPTRTIRLGRTASIRSTMTSPTTGRSGTTDMTAARRVVVTGANGFIGRHVVAQLQGEGADVNAISRRWTDAADLDSLLGNEPVEQCVHLAWPTDPSSYLSDADTNASAASATLALFDR